MLADGRQSPSRYALVGAQALSFRLGFPDSLIEVALIPTWQSEFNVACPGLSIPATTVLFPSPDCNTLLLPTTFTSSAINPTTQELPPPSFYRLPARGRRGAIETFAESGDGRRIVVGGVDGLSSVVELVEQVVVKPSATRRTRVVKGKETALRGHVGDLTDAAFVSRPRMRRAVGT